MKVTGGMKGIRDEIEISADARLLNGAGLILSFNFYRSGGAVTIMANGKPVCNVEPEDMLEICKEYVRWHDVQSRL